VATTQHLRGVLAEVPGGQQATRQGRLDPAVRPAAGHPVRPGVGYEPTARPEMNRQKRVIFAAYVVMAVEIVLFLPVTAVLWWRGV
jgi:hypothetical protein